MNNKIKNIIKNFTHVFSANAISLLISLFSIVIIPKIIGVEEYGYWQLYMFYISYVGFFHLGHADGVYLKYGGRSYDQLNRRIFVSQFWILVFFELFFSVCIFLTVYLNIDNFTELFIITMVCINMVIILPRTLLILTLQATNRMRDYARVLTTEKILYGIIMGAFIICGIRDYKILIYADILAKGVSFSLSIFYCKDIVIGNFSDLKTSIKEAIDNVRIGIKLMFANIASLLIIGTIRFGIEKNWDIATFGKISLTLSISNMLMIFVNAIGTILYPMLRNTPTTQLPKIYTKMRDMLMIFLIGLLTIYFPAKWALSLWLPQYNDSLHYMALLFPICIYESKMSMLISTYYKALRKEKLMMVLNWITVGMSLIATYVCTYIVTNLTLSVITITILIAFRCIISEVILAFNMNVRVWKDTILELLITIGFILPAWFISDFKGMLIFISVYCIYLLIKRKELNDILTLALTMKSRLRS